MNVVFQKRNAVISQMNSIQRTDENKPLKLELFSFWQYVLYAPSTVVNVRMPSCAFEFCIETFLERELSSLSINSIEYTQN